MCAKRRPTGVEFGPNGTLKVVGSGIRHYLTLALGALTMAAAVVAWALLNGVPAYEPVVPPAPSADPTSTVATPGVPSSGSLTESEPGAGPTPDICLNADARGVVPRDRWTPCGQLLGYFDDWATPPPGAPGSIMEP